MPGAELAVLRFASSGAWESWLEEHHAQAPGVWLEFAKRGAAPATLTRSDALDGALCFGWIDGQVRSVDEGRYRQRFTPRRARSRGSQINRDRVAALQAAGRMRPAGLAEVEHARADGRWDAAYAGSRSATVPEDLERALAAASPPARAFFAALSSANRYAILYRVEEARRAQTRVARIARIIAMLEAGETFHP